MPTCVANWPTPCAEWYVTRICMRATPASFSQQRFVLADGTGWCGMSSARLHACVGWWARTHQRTYALTNGRTDEPTYGRMHIHMHPETYTGGRGLPYLLRYRFIEVFGTLFSCPLMIAVLIFMQWNCIINTYSATCLPKPMARCKPSINS